MSSPDSPVVLVIGATGRTGVLLVSELLQRGYAVRALVRDAAAARSRLPAATQLLAGELHHAHAVAAAVSGVAAVLFVASAGALAQGDPRAVDFAGVAALVDAAQTAAVDYFVLLSSASVTHPEHPHNCTFRSVLRWKLRGENHLRTSELRYTIVRALGLRDRQGGQQGVRMVQGDRLAFGEDIARADVAEFLAAVLAMRIAPTGPAVSASVFAPDFVSTSLLCASIEVYNDSSIAPHRARSREPLQADCAPTTSVRPS